mmetsp:Transcript_44243/g.96250  ORF Transcript_44243/g.96250 Transcript_44243/m.96250 type:complete len:81 (-) Transcript_44243:91-333(-)
MSAPAMSSGGDLTQVVKPSSNAVVFALGFGALGGFALGFLAAERIYADERERKTVRKATKIALGSVAALGVTMAVIAKVK